MHLKLVAGAVAVVALAVGGFWFARETGVRSLSRTLNERMGAGEYLAALAVAGKLKEKGETTPELEATIREAARLLVAEDTFVKAKKAAEEGRFADARTLLSESEAVTNPAFQKYREAKELLEQAEAFAAGKAHETAVKIQSLQSEAEKEKQRRAETESQKKSQEKSFEQTLKEKEGVISQTRAETAATAEALRKAEQESKARQAALESEQARAKGLMEQVEKESRQKFFVELRTYRDMAQKGKEQLESAATEISAKRDVTALLYISQGKILFEEAKRKAEELRASRTPSAQAGSVDNLLKALGEFLESGKQFRNAVVYMENQSSTEFTGSMEKAKAALANGAALLGKVSEVITAFGQ